MNRTAWLIVGAAAVLLFMRRASAAGPTASVDFDDADVIVKKGSTTLFDELSRAVAAQPSGKRILDGAGQWHDLSAARVALYESLLKVHAAGGAGGGLSCAGVEGNGVCLDFRTGAVSLY